MASQWRGGSEPVCGIPLKIPPSSDWTDTAPVQPHEDRTHPTAWVRHVELWTSRSGRSGSMKPRFRCHHGSGISQSPGLLQQHPGQRTKWLAWTASIGSQSWSASGFTPSSSLASIGTSGTRNFTLLDIHKPVTFQAVRPRIRTIVYTNSLLVICLRCAFHHVWFLEERPFDHRLFLVFCSRGYPQNPSACVVSSMHVHLFGTIFHLIWESLNFLYVLSRDS